MLRTKDKIKLARAMSSVVVGARKIAGKGSVLRAARDGINWRLDLGEGIDFAIYLGRYQSLPRRIVDACIKPGALVIDIGANIGAHSLPLAAHVGSGGCVIAVEPTDYAVGRLKSNIALNPDLEARLMVIQAALTDTDVPTGRAPEFYSRWPLRRDAAKLHDSHLGRLETAGGARLMTLDTLIDELRGQRKIEGPVAFVKLDVDGNELSVLRGGRRTLTGERPVMLIEMAPYVQDEQPGRLVALLSILSEYGYRLEHADTGRDFPMSADAVRRTIGDGAGLDLVAQPA